MFCVANVNELGLTEIDVAVTWPVPLRVTDCGEPLALSVMVTAAVRVPALVGENVTLMVHVPLMAKLFGQLLVCAKSAAFVPPTAMELIVTA